MTLSDFSVLSFDCYGTLIDWEAGLTTALKPLVERSGLSLSPDAVLAAFADHESRQQAETPAMPYSALLAVVHARLAASWNVAISEDDNRRFGASVGDWPPFPDTVDALRTLKRRYRLVILSNVDRESFQHSNRRLGDVFDAVYTAQDIGSYKPDARNFTYLRDRLAETGVPVERVLHVAQSLFHDHAPANKAGFASAWIDRRHDRDGWGATAAPPVGVRYDWRFTSLSALVEAVDAA